MIRTQVQLTENQFDFLKKAAAENNTSIAEIVRLSINNYIKATSHVDKDERKRRALAAAGRFKSAISDLALEHDKHLAEAFGNE